MSEYETYDFPSCAEALAKVRKQRKAGKPITWTGPDNLHHAIGAVCPPPSELFSEESLRYSKEDQGHGFWDVYTMVAFQLGYHNGMVRGEERAEAVEERVLLLSTQLAAANRELAALKAEGGTDEG